MKTEALTKNDPESTVKAHVGKVPDNALSIA